MALNMKRKKRVMQGCANPLFVKWIEELRDAAKEKELQSQFTYAKALNSLKKYPLPLQSGEEAKILDYIGDKLAKMLDKKLLEHQRQVQTSTCQPSPVKMSSRGSGGHFAARERSSQSLRTPVIMRSSPVLKISRASPGISLCGGLETRQCSSGYNSPSSSSPRESPPPVQKKVPTAKEVKQREYVPAYRSGSYALIIALYRGREKPSWKGYSLKAELIRDAQPFSSESFAVSNAGSYYTAWSSMSTLIRKGLVEKRSSPAKYSLTKLGEQMALQLLQASQSIISSSEPVESLSTSDSLVGSDLPSSARTSSIEELSAMKMKFSLESPEFQLEPGSFDVILLVDSSESTASRKSTSQFNGILLQELGKNGVAFDVRKLNVGDFTWVAREKTIPKPGSLSVSKNCEAVLEYIIERKRIDDLAGSIIDGRFKEQKFRIMNSGILHPIYLIEEHGGISHSKLDGAILDQAITNTQVQDGFFMKWTKDICGTVAYLTFMTRSLQQVYMNKTIQAYPRDVLVELTKERQANGERLKNLSENIVQVMSFNSFNEGSLKNKEQSVQEVFVRQLMMVPGVSVERAAVLVNKYPTLSHLHKAYSDCSGEEEKVTLLEYLRSGNCNRRFGKSLSELVYAVYGK